jgi:hypothetical protein
MELSEASVFYTREQTDHKWYKSGLPRRQEQLANKNWIYSAMRQTTGTLSVYS